MTPHWFSSEEPDMNQFGPTRDRLRRARRQSTVYRLLRPIPEPALRILALIEPEESSRRITEYVDRLKDVSIELTGADLRALGIKPGPRYREIMDRLLDARLDGRVTSREEELAMCRRLA